MQRFSREKLLQHIFFLGAALAELWQYTLHCNAESQLESNRAIRSLPTKICLAGQKGCPRSLKALVCLHCQVLTFTRPLRFRESTAETSIGVVSPKNTDLLHSAGRRLSVPRLHSQKPSSAHPTVLNSTRSVTHLSKPIIEGILGLIMHRGMS